MDMTQAKTPIMLAYDKALEEAQMDMGSVRWITSRRLEVKISGAPVSVDVEEVSEEGIRNALAEALNLHCIRVATISAIRSQGKPATVEAVREGVRAWERK